MSTIIKHEQTPIFRCDIYPSLAVRAAGGEQIDRLAVVAAALQSFVDKRCRDDLQGYVWQREPLRIGVARATKDGSRPARVTASMRHGGSVEDEWLAVHLLMLASESDEFSEMALLAALRSDGADSPTPSSTSPGLIFASPIDEDGDLVLIEAADVLPSWVQPSNAGGRVWLVGGEFQIVPPEILAGDGNEGEASFNDATDGRPLKHSTGLGILFQQLAAPTTIAASIKAQRMPSYPSLSWASDAQHTTLAYLPIVAAKVVARCPQVVADAAEAFSSRDGPMDARTLRDLTVFGSPSASSSFLTRVRLPRRMYAALLADQYFPPKVFGTPWRDAVMQYRDAVERGGGNDADEEQRVLQDEGRRRDLGCKIACGLELAFANAKKRRSNHHRSMFSARDDDDAVRSSPSYTRFVQSLTIMGFFGSELRDSYEWKQRERMAMTLWREQANARVEGGGDGDDDDSSDTMKRLAFLLDAVPSCARDRSLPPHVDAAQGWKALKLLEDPDDFLFDAPDPSPMIDGGEDGEKEAERAALQQIGAFSDKLNSFVEGQGDEAGALFDDEGMDGAGDRESDGEDDDADEQRKAAKDRLALLSVEERDRAKASVVPPFEGRWGAQSGGKAAANDASTVTTPPTAGFSRHVKYDGASDSDESIDDEVLRAGDTDDDRLSRARWLDMEADLLQDEERRRMAAEDGDLDDAEWDDEDGDAGSELGQDDVMGFVEFTRKELGLTTEQFNDILDQRRQRGAYVPDLPSGSKNKSTRGMASAQKPKSTSAADHQQDDGAKTFRQQTRDNAQKSLRNQRTTDEEKRAAGLRAEAAVKAAEQQHSASSYAGTSSSSQRDPFQQLMDAMDAQLLEHRGGHAAASAAPDPAAADPDSDEEMNDLSAQDAELLERMLHSGPPASLQVLLQKQHDAAGATDTSGRGLTSVEQHVLDGMLRSYEAQMGSAGPVGSLVGRFGLGRLPLNQDGVERLPGGGGASSSTDK